MTNRRMLMGACAGIVVALFAMPAFAQIAAVEAPRDIVAQMYQISAGKDGNYSGESAVFQPAVRKRWFSKSLSAALDAMDRKSKRTNDAILDFDPLTNSQDPSVKRLAISQESASATKTVVVAKFFAYEEKEPVNVRYIFVRDGGAWKLDDMSGDRGGKDRWVLRTLIK